MEKVQTSNILNKINGLLKEDDSKNINKFTTKVDFYITYKRSGDKKTEYHLKHGTVKGIAEFEIDIDYRSWGIKDIDLILTDINVTFDVEAWSDDPDLDGEIVDTITIDTLKDYNIEYNFVYTQEKNLVTISDIDINVNDKKIIVNRY